MRHDALNEFAQARTFDEQNPYNPLAQRINRTTAVEPVHPRSHAPAWECCADAPRPVRMPKTRMIRQKVEYIHYNPVREDMWMG